MHTSILSIPVYINHANYVHLANCNCTSSEWYCRVHRHRNSTAIRRIDIANVYAYCTCLLQEYGTCEVLERKGKSGT
jgi:hypothetical protein